MIHVHTPYTRKRYRNICKEFIYLIRTHTDTLQTHTRKKNITFVHIFTQYTNTEFKTQDTQAQTINQV